MEADTATRYRSRILREMNANRDNPFNSPPSSTGSHGTVSPTLSSVFSDPDGESTRRLNEDIARITGPRKLPVNWEAAHRKWPEFFGMPKTREVPIFDDDTDTRPMSAESKENKPPALAVKFNDDSTQDPWLGSNRTRAEMQPRVDNESDLSSIISKSPARALSNPAMVKNLHHPSPLSKVHNRASSDNAVPQREQRRESVSDAIDRLRNTSRSPRTSDQRDAALGRNSPRLSSAKSSLTAVPSSPDSIVNQSYNDTNVRSFFMPDVSHLGDFVTGTLRFSGSLRNGVPILVKNGRVHDVREKPSSMRHAQVDSLEVPEDEEKIFVSMDMIREEIVSLQEHYEKVQEYAENLQQQVEELEAQLKSQKSGGGNFNSIKVNEHLMEQKDRLEVEVSTLQSRLEQASRKMSLNEIEKDAVTQEKERAVRKLQEACEDINKLTRKLSVKEKELETTHRQLESTEQMRQDNDTLRRDLKSLKHGRDTLESENVSLKADNETLRRELQVLKEEIESLRSDSNMTRREHQSLINENRSLRTNNKALIDENEDLRENLDGVQHELDASREEVEALQHDIQAIGQEKSTLREDNSSLVRHNEKYFSENKSLRRENSGFERSLHDMHDENAKLKDEVEFLKQQLDHCRPLPKEDLTGRFDDETEENMTSAFFIPDITINTNDDENTENKTVPDSTLDTNRLPTLPEATEQETRNTTKRENTTMNTGKRDTDRKSKSKSRSSSSKSMSQNQKVAFSIPDDASKHGSTVANQGSKRRNASQNSQRSSSKGTTNPFNDLDDTTGLQSIDNTTQDQSIQLSVVPKSRKESSNRESRQSTIQDITSQSQKHTRTQSRSSHRHTIVTDITADSIKSATTETCPALSHDARRVLDNLCEHNCRNCIVCSRITSHRGVLSSADVASGKKRVTVSRPIPVTDRDLTLEDPTIRPSQSPGQALALVIKGLEDEAHHMQLELSRIQVKYNSSDKALGRRERLNMAERIRNLLKRLEVKNDQIYNLYDVLEGQKAAGQNMTEEEVELTVLNITGMTVRDVTSGSDQLTWEGIPGM